MRLHDPDIRDFREAIDRDPDCARAYADRAASSRSHDRQDEARKDAQRVFELAPKAKAPSPYPIMRARLP